MTQEDKELLLIDLCARLPYGIVCLHPYGPGKLESIAKNEYGIEVTFKTPDNNYYDIEQCRPYLRPMSSMTDEEKKELIHLVVYVEGPHIIKQIKDGGFDIMEGKYQFHSLQVLDWLNKKGFDYRGLIPKGLALPAPVGMY